MTEGLDGKMLTQVTLEMKWDCGLREKEPHLCFAFKFFPVKQLVKN